MPTSLSSAPVQLRKHNKMERILLIRRTYQEVFSVSVYKDNHNMQMDLYRKHDHILL